MTCPVCGTVAVPGARFCHNCGAALPAAATLPAAERRIVTVLFGDLSDFTSWSEDLDPERVGAVTDRVLAALAGAVKTFGGHVDKLTGDGIMAVFGAPVALDDHAGAALAAAREMARRLEEEVPEIRAGIGVATGEVVAGNVGHQRRFEYTVIGDAANTAARLTELAKDVDGRLLATWASVQAAGNEEAARWRERGSTTLRGRTDATALAVPGLASRSAGTPGSVR